jgi:parallel beta-helix repeat protein
MKKRGKEKMKKAKVNAICIIGMIALIAAIMVMPAAATTWTVDPSETDSLYHIMLQAAPGDTVIFPSGHVYNPYINMGTVVMDIPNIKWIGEGGADTVTLDMANHFYVEMEAPGCILDGFKIVNSGKGVYVKSPDCIIRNCVFEGLTAYAKLYSYNTTIENNLFVNGTSKYCPLGLFRPFCTVTNSTFINNKGAGILLYAASDNVVTRNSIISCGKGIWLYKAGEGNKIYLNNFIDNGVSVAITSTTTTNIWNSTEQIDYVYGSTEYTNYLGNYWSPQYTGSDGDGDGIGDTAYPIPGSATDEDYRPLMAGFENYPEPSRPDLDLKPTAITAPVIFAGEPNTITATIANIGTVDADSFNVSLSADGNVVDTATVDSLNGGMSTNVSFQWTPASAGEYKLCVLADCDGSVNELDETNNEMCIEVEIKPDLVTTEVTTAALLLLNQSSVVNASIANVGTVDAGSFNVSLSADGAVVDTVSVASLGVGNDTNVSFQWTPASVGEVDLCVAADSDGTVDELNETNNETCVVVWVHAPDLVPTAMTPDAFFPGKPNTITATVENMGDADAGSFNVALSANGAVVDTASVASLGISDSTEVSFSWTATVGDHELCVLADTDSEVDESDETNNELCKNVTVYPNTVYLVPKDSGAPYCCEAEVEVWVKAEDGFQGGQINLTYSLDCANVTGVEFNPVWDFDSATWWDTYEGYTRISFAKSVGTVNGDVWIGNLMIHCTSEDIDTLCSTTLSYVPVTKLVNDFGTEIETNLIKGTFGCDLAKVRIEPETLNLKSKGVFTAFITLPEPYDIADINVSTVECEGAPAVDYSIIPGKDTLRVKFDREDLREDLPTGDAVTMRVTGEMQTGKIFEGRDTIRVIA